MFPTSKATLTRKLIAIAIFASLLLLVSACTVQKQGKGENENVKIETPVGGLNVNTSDVNPSDVGVAVYPGARLKPDGEGEHSRANVNVSSSLFGVKVVALNYVSDDPPQKLIDFYKKELAKYGEVLECKNGVHEESDQLKCNEKPRHDRDKLELVVGTKERQHIVSVKPDGKGSEFGLVYVQVRGKESAL
ncbi:MAG TPA: hypothetical protein VD837_00550 [Terriglobales bacterium]|nr:hypothetical protein [Terriglobales bacterium]